METHVKVVDCYEIKIDRFADSPSVVTKRKINPKTGKGWQRALICETFSNPTKAMFFWCRLK